ncbi:MAG: EamA family transporter [Rhodospirillales bacterium]|nr:EamA family transporter [Rhodospirillales bacterium]
MLGVVYGILAAACFGFNNASARRAIISGTAIQGLVISMPLGILIFTIGATAVGEWDQFSKLTYLNIGLLSMAGFMHFAWGRYFNILSLGAVGSNLAGPVQQFQLLLALTLAVIFLGETLTPLKVIGILLIVSAPAYILRQRAKAKAKEALEDKPAETGANASAFKPQMAKGYLYAFLASLGFGSSAVFVRAGLDGTNLSFLGGFVSYVAASAIMGFVLFIPSQLSQVKQLNGTTAKWFLFSGVGVSFSQLFRYLALGIAPVTIVQPLQSLSLMFRMIFGYFFNRQHESFDRYVIVGIFLSFIGAVSLSLSSDIVLQYFDLPDWLAKIAGWTWP